MAVSLQRARARVLEACRALPTEVVPVANALGRVLAKPLIARVDVPPFANSAMDGFAVTSGPAGRTLRIVGESLAGAPAAGALDSTTAIRIATGASVPPHADAVVPDEQASLVDDVVELHIPARPGLNIRLAGEDFPAGLPVLEAGTRLGPVELAVAIGAGHGDLVCHRQPRVALLGTGNELRPPGERLEPGQIYDSNTTALAGLATRAGGLVVSRDRVGDDPPATRRALQAGLEHADLVIVTGGASVGPQDHVRAALAALGADDEFSAIQIRPGRPASFATCRGVPVLALPGNPVAAIVIFILLGRPALAGLAGRRPPADPERAVLANPAEPSPVRTTIVGVTLRQTLDGPLEASASGPLSAHATHPLLAYDALAVIPPGEHPLAAGTPVEILRISV
jgi:molybdopterin molybdotransferase